MVKAILALSLWLVAQVSSCVLVASVPSFLLTIVLLCFLYISTDTEQVLPFTGGGLFPSLWIPGSLVLHGQSGSCIVLVVQSSSCGLVASVLSSVLTIIFLSCFGYIFTDLSRLSGGPT